MPPRSSDDAHDQTVLVSSLGIKPPAQKTDIGDDWLEIKQVNDGAEGLWRIHDSIYDLTNFIDKHPGGRDWIALTKGTDITEAYEVHHIKLPNSILKKYFIKNASTKRNSPFTFHEDGFFRTLRRESEQVLKQLPKQTINTSAFFIDMFVVGYFTFAILACTYWNYLLAIFAGNILTFLTIAAHNYFHQKDNFRMHYFNFSLMPTREWRISHVLSHHLHTNTIEDMEIAIVEPFFQYLPKHKSFVARYGPWLYYPIVWCTGFHLYLIKTIVRVFYGKTNHLSWTNLIPFSTPLAMYLLSGQTLLATLWMWTFIILVASTHFFFVGLNAAHHHPEIFHDGDTPRAVENYDWGLAQLDAVMDRHEITGSHFLVLTNFGDHALHHLFPTLDHGVLAMLYPLFNDICKRFNIELRTRSQWELIKGSFLQMARIRPNPSPPNLSNKFS